MTSVQWLDAARLTAVDLSDAEEHSGAVSSSETEGVRLLARAMWRERLPQQAVAAWLGTSQSFVSRLLRGEAEPSVHQAVQLWERWRIPFRSWTVPAPAESGPGEQAEEGAA